MELIFEVILQALGELLLQIFFEFLAEVGLRSVNAITRRRANPWIAAMAYALLGAIAGGISLLVFSSLFLKTPEARLANLVLTPIAAGLAMTALGAWRRNHDQPTIRIDRFAYGYLFALGMASVRFAFGD